MSLKSDQLELGFSIVSLKLEVLVARNENPSTETFNL